MELPVAVFVVIAVGAVALGLLTGWVASRWYQRNHVAPKDETAASRETDEPGTPVGPDDGGNSARELRSELDEAEARLDRLEVQLRARDEELVRVGDEAAIAKRELADFKARFSDIVGLEAENSTLRLIAARVPDLERRVAELERDSPRVIDLRETPAQSS
ncbi:MAG: hypothetical protein ACR2PK_07065 [Acidimicrobiales bacterium]